MIVNFLGARCQIDPITRKLPWWARTFHIFFPLLGAMNCLSAIAHQRERLLHLAFPFFWEQNVKHVCRKESLLSLQCMSTYMSTISWYRVLLFSPVKYRFIYTNSWLSKGCMSLGCQWCEEIARHKQNIEPFPKSAYLQVFDHWWCLAHFGWQNFAGAKGFADQNMLDHTSQPRG